MLPSKGDSFKGEKIIGWELVKNEGELLEILGKLKLPRPIRVTSYDILRPQRGVLRSFKGGNLSVSMSCHAKKGVEETTEVMFFEKKRCFAIAVLEGEES